GGGTPTAAMLASADSLRRAREASGQGGTLIFFSGRLVYTRPGSGNTPTQDVGAMGVRVSLMDEDPGFDDELAATFTDYDGNFYYWAYWDGQLLEGDPELYIKFETDHPWVVVQEGFWDIEYSWNTSVRGSSTADVHIGTYRPSDLSTHPAIHIATDIAKNHVWYQEEAGYFLDGVDVKWPDGDNAFFDPLWGQIHISHQREWNEATHAHEYGHYFVHTFGRQYSPSYCNGICDSPDCGHCLWCEEGRNEAYSEGWPDWISAVQTRSYASKFGLDAVNHYSFESIASCFATGTFTDPAKTEGNFAAVLWDIYDGGAGADDTDPNVLTSGEQEAGFKQWWGDGDGQNPDDAAKAEFDKVAGDLLATRFYTFAGPLAADLKAKGYTPAQIAAALVYDKTGAAGQQAGFSYRGLIFGAGAAEAGMSFSRAKQQMTDNGISAPHAEEVLRKDYGAVTVSFYFQKKVKERGEWTSDLYTKVEASIPKYQAFSGTTIQAGFHPGTQDPVPMPEPFDPGDPGAGTNPQELLEHNMEVAAVYQPATGPALSARSHMYVENYRQITNVSANFTGEMASDQVPNSVPVQPGARRPATLPLTAADGGQASFSLEDPAQQNGNLTANVDIGDGLNGYVVYYRDPVAKTGSVVLRWEAARPMPPGQTTRNNTRLAGPVFATPSGEANNIFQELAADYENLYELNLSPENRAWFDPIVFSASGSPNRPEICEALIAEKWKQGGDPFNGHDPRVAFPDENGYQTKITLNFDQSQSSVGTEQTTSIFKPGDVILSQVYTQNSPTGRLYKLASENTPEDQKIKDVKGNTIEPTGENVTLQAQTCCGVTSVVGGSVVKKDDQNRPNAQISAVEQGTTGTGAQAVMVPEMAAFGQERNFRFVCHEKGHSPGHTLFPIKEGYGLHFLGCKVLALVLRFATTSRGLHRVLRVRHQEILRSTEAFRNIRSMASFCVLAVRQ
ncbi:MAG: hypothetical protein HUU35_08240, partial [Armatimonadetes bacterium]|nr:hypothetical protein [Armatimonadota bacterium]